MERRPNVTADELARVTEFLAEVAADFGAMAGVGAMETAGGFVSFLAVHPENCEMFIDTPLRAVPAAFWAHGCLSWHDTSGEVVTPSQAQKLRGKLQ